MNARAAALLALLSACASPTEDSKRPPRDTSPALQDTGDTGETSTGDTADTGETADSGDSTGETGDTAPAEVDPPLGGTSGGSGGEDDTSGGATTLGGVSARLLTPSGASRATALPFLLVISGTEGSAAMMANMKQVTRYAHIDDAVIVVLDGQSVRGADAASVVDAVRGAYDIDNDRTWLLSESAGTTAGLQVGLHLRQSVFAAYWANDVNARDTPGADATALGFAPWGNAGPGGDLPDAQAIVDGMDAASYQLPADAPYSGSGSDTHGSSDQFLEAVSFFHDKARE